jgi:hypothetical protein
MGYGGPHAAYFAQRKITNALCQESLEFRKMLGNRALRMALQTREQHIKREKQLQISLLLRFYCSYGRNVCCLSHPKGLNIS